MLQIAKIGLGIAERDIRVSAGSVQPVCRPLSVGLSSAFAKAIARRYKGKQALWTQPLTIFRQLMLGITMSPAYHQAQVQLSPRLALTVLNWSRSHRIPPANALTAVLSTPTLKIEPLVIRQPFSSPGHEQLKELLRVVQLPFRRTVQEHRQIETLVRRLQTKSQMEGVLTEQLVHRLANWGKRFETVATAEVPAASAPGSSQVVSPKIGGGALLERLAPVEQLLRRLVTRGERVEEVAKAEIRQVASPRVETGTPREVSKLLEQPVARVFRRTASSPRDFEVAVPRSDAQQQVFPIGVQPAGSRLQVTDSRQIDLNGLTDQVVQAIDRRIIAQRERLGRF